MEEKYGMEDEGRMEEVVWERGDGVGRVYVGGILVEGGGTKEGVGVE